MKKFFCAMIEQFWFEIRIFHFAVKRGPSEEIEAGAVVHGPTHDYGKLPICDDAERERKAAGALPCGSSSRF